MLAAVQAAVLDCLMETCPDVAGWVSQPELVVGKRSQALVKALARVIKRAAPGAMAALKIVGSGDPAALGADATFKQYMSSLRVYTATGLAEAERAIGAMVAGQLGQRKGFGLLSFLFSVVLTRGTDVISKDMDDPSCGLIGGYG